MLGVLGQLKNQLGPSALQARLLLLLLLIQPPAVVVQLLPPDRAMVLCQQRHQLLQHGLLLCCWRVASLPECLKPIQQAVQQDHSRSSPSLPYHLALQLLLLLVGWCYVRLLLRPQQLLALLLP